MVTTAAATAILLFDDYTAIFRNAELTKFYSQNTNQTHNSESSI